jgi:DNA polymerase I-like protein with 3'-5' exonuclease and polymerase domains
MNILTIDVETTIFQKGNPFSRQNKLVAIGIKWNDDTPIIINPYSTIKVSLDTADVIVGFNLKFDLHWFKRNGIFDAKTYAGRFWDCQLVDFILEQQTTPYPSLNGVCAKYNLGQKIDTINEKYWSQGIDTDQIPPQELHDYLIQDLELTYKLYKHQQSILPQTKQRIISLANQDIGILQTMEYNGLYLDMDAMQVRNTTIVNEIAGIEKELNSLFETTSEINFSSHDHLSCLMYGGVVEYPQRVAVGVYKSGSRVGHPKYKNFTYKILYEGITTPIKGSELKKAGYYSTDITTLKQLKIPKDKKKILDLLIKRSELTKLSSTYLNSLVELNKKMDWEPNKIHGQFNQCVAITGRLSSSKPNLQNIPSEMKEFIRSQYV